MKKFMQASLLALAAAAASAPVRAQVEIQWWHSMGGALGEALNGVANDFNASQKDYKVVTTYTGSYPESM
ncbi:MAG: sn-glycerol-3-phosphate ABC transporter substrate-binding protein, partial [Rubrivivax sp.]